MGSLSSAKVNKIQKSLLKGRKTLKTHCPKKPKENDSINPKKLGAQFDALVDSDEELNDAADDGIAILPQTDDPTQVPLLESETEDLKETNSTTTKSTSSIPNNAEDPVDIEKTGTNLPPAIAVTPAKSAPTSEPPKTTNQTNPTTQERNREPMSLSTTPTKQKQQNIPKN